MKFSALLAAVGLQPKTLTEARETLEPAKATLDSVNALFSTAGLDLETLLAAGPESLKAHLDSLSVKAEEYSSISAQLSDLTEKLTKSESDAFVLSDALKHITTAIALPAPAAHTDVAAIKSAFDAHVQKQVVLANAKAGHPPVHQIDANAGPAAEQLTDEAHLAAYEKLEGTEAKAYLSTHSQALWRADIARRTTRR
jgi:hypothetical protein